MADKDSGETPLLEERSRESAAGLSSERSSRSAAYFRSVAELGVQAAEALEYAHLQGVVHRDIKPSNLLLDEDSNLWITDFGLAQCQNDSGLTMTGDLLGTIRYMSPEQALAKRVRVDHRTDIYSLGVTLYELLTLRPAFDGQSPQEILRQIALEELRPPRRLNKAIPVDLETVVLKAMARNPGDRYATAEDLADDMKRYLQDEPVKAKRPTLAARVAKWSRRHRALVASTAVLLVVAVIGLAVSTVMIAQERAEAIRQRDLALSHRQRAEINYQQAEVQRQRAEENLHLQRAAANEADKQRQLAETSFRQARQAVDEYYTLVSENALLDFPTLEPLRKELLNGALGYYQRFIEHHGDDPGVRAELAAASFRVATILYEERSPEWIESFNHGLELVEQLVEEEATLPELGSLAEGISRRRGRAGPVPREALPLFRRAARLWETLVRGYPEVAGFRNDLAGTNTALAYCEMTYGNPLQALLAIRRARELWKQLADENPSVAQYRAQLGLTVGTLAVGQFGARQYVAAAESGREAVAIGEDLVADFPNVPNYHEGLATGYYWVGMSLWRTGDSDAAVEALRRSMDIRKKLAADFPTVKLYGEQVMTSSGDLASWLVASGKFKDAEELLREWLAIQRKQLGNEDLSVAATLVTLGNVLCTRMKYDEAEQCFGEAVAIYRRGGVQHQRSILTVLTTLATLRLAADDIAGNREICAKLLEEFGQTDDPDTANDLAWACTRFPNAIESPEQAVRLAEQAVAKRPIHIFQNTLGAALYRTGRFEQSVARLNEGIQAHGKGGEWSDWLLLAMAHEKLGHRDEARNWLARAHKWVGENVPQLARSTTPDGQREAETANPENNTKDETSSQPLSWDQRLELELFLREAEALVGVKED